MSYLRMPPPPTPHPWAIRLSLAALALVGAMAFLTEPAGGRFVPPAARVTASTTLVINEVDYDQPGTDSEEFLEIKNIGSAGIDLGEYDVLGVNGGTNPGTEYRRTSLDAVTLSPGDYYVIGSSGVANVDQVIGTTNIWQNGAPDALALVRNTTGNPDDDELIDSVSYEGDTAGGPLGGGSWTETAGVDPGDNNTDDYLGLSRYTDGTDTDDNSTDLSPRCITPGETNTSENSGCQAPGSPTATITATSTSTAVPTATDTPQAGPTDTPQPTATDTPVSTATNTPASTSTSTPQPTATDTPQPTATDTAQPTATNTAEPASTATSTATATQASTGTATATSAPPTPMDEPPLAVTLADFRALRWASHVQLEWATLTEIHHAGFRVLRQVAGDEPLNLTPRLIAPRSAGGEFGGSKYEYLDWSAPRSAVQYWLEDVDTRDPVTRHGPVDVGPSDQPPTVRPRPQPAPQPVPGPGIPIGY